MDFLIIGSGLTGATIARLLTDRGKKCLVVERRSHLGGNVYDEEHPSGVRVHTYGPHYFRTSSLRIWNFVRRFAEFYPFEARVQSWVQGRYENWPPGEVFLSQLSAEERKPGFQGIPSNFEEMALSKMPRSVYDAFVKGYTQKQWGVAPASLSSALAKRFRLQQGSENRLTPKARFQGLPAEGYRMFIEKMLQGIPTLIEVDYLLHQQAFRPREKIIYTGPIDAFFGYDLGLLQYRGQQRLHAFLPDTHWAQPVVQVNNPGLENGPHIRTIEWKHLLPPQQAGSIPGTLLTQEIPFSPTDPNHYEYPFPDTANQALYLQYKKRAQTLHNVLFCGRLGEYRYLDMDQAIARAMKVAK